MCGVSTLKSSFTWWLRSFWCWRLYGGGGGGLKKGTPSIVVWVVLAACAWYFDVYASIVFGVLMAVIARQYGSWQLNPVAIAFFIVLLIISSIGLHNYEAYYIKIAPFAAIAIVMLLARKGRRSAIGSIAGGMSYPLYLNHWMGVYVFNYLMPGQHGILRIALATIASIVIATILYLFYDKKLLERRDGWFNLRRGFGIMFVAYSVIILGLIYGFLKTSI